jgi:phosphoribosylglycinamide formyltransferase 1
VRLVATGAVALEGGRTRVRAHPTLGELSLRSPGRA